MSAKLSIQFSLLESRVILTALQLAKRDYYSALCEHPISPMEGFELKTVVKTIKKLEEFRQKQKATLENSTPHTFVYQARHNSKK